MQPPVRQFLPMPNAAPSGDSSPASVVSSTGPLPTELSGDRQTRVAYVALLYAGLYLVAWTAQLLFSQAAMAPMEALTWVSDASRASLERAPVGLIAGVASILGAIAFWAQARYAQLNERHICAMGTKLQVLGALGITVAEQWGSAVAGTPSGHGASWVAFWIVLFPMVVPTFPKRALFAALIAASTVPIVAALNGAFGAPSLAAPDIALLVFPGYFAAGAAYFSSRFIYSLGTSASRARRLGSYALGESIGAGGMGEVWSAQHELLKRPAAVKLIRPERLAAAGEAPATVLRRFAREAKATAALESPHTVTVYDYGVTQDGTFYYVMELLRGMDLESLVRRFGPLPSERVAALLAQLMKSLADAHSHGLVHRDIKPANIFAARLGTELDFVKVLDFGLVTAASDESDQSRLTQEGNTSGTPAYLAPEIATGDAEIGPAVDIYSAGCVAYWLLTGRLVFDADNAMQMVLRHVRETPTPPSRVTELPIHPELERLVMQMLEKDPAKRPSSAHAIACDLLSIRFDTPWTVRRAVDWWSTHAPELTADMMATCSAPPLRLSA